MEGPLVYHNTELQEAAALRAQLAAAHARIEALETLQAVTLWVTSELQLDSLLAEVLSAAVAVIGADAGALLLVDDGHEQLEYAVVSGGPGSDLLGRRRPLDEGAAGWVIARREPLVLADSESADGLESDLLAWTQPSRATLICVPLTAKGRAVGALELVRGGRGQECSDDDIALLTALAGEAAIAIENARLYLQLAQERDRILAVEQEVRNQLARDLHDGPAQLLASLIMRLRLGMRLLDGGQAGAREEFAALEPMLERTLRGVRTMLFDLRPVILEARGLAAALEEYARRQRSEGFGLSLSTRGEPRRLPAEKERAMFAIVREAVTNARKHSGTDEAQLSLSFGDDRVVLTVSDRGSGFGPAEAEEQGVARGSLGLVNMRERTEAIGGRLVIRSAPGLGTRIVLTVPA